MKLFPARKRRELISSTCLFIPFSTSCCSRGSLKVSLCFRALSHRIVMFSLSLFFCTPFYSLQNVCNERNISWKVILNKKKKKKKETYGWYGYGFVSFIFVVFFFTKLLVTTFELHDIIKRWKEKQWNESQQIEKSSARHVKLPEIFFNLIYPSMHCMCSTHNIIKPR